MRVDKDGVVHFDTGGGNLGGHGDGANEGGGYNDGGNYGSPGDADQTAVNTALMDMALASAPSHVQDVMAPTSLAELAAALEGMNLTDKTNVDLAGVMSPQHSSGVSYADLAALAAAGLGKMDVPGFGQNIEQALAAQNVHNVLNYAVPAFVNLVPGYGLMSSIGRGISTAHALIDGRLTPAQAFPSLAGAVIGAKTGIPSGILEGLFENNPGKAAGAGAQAGLGALASNFGPAGSLAYGLSGIGPSVGKAVSDAVSGATGGSKSSGLGSLSGSGAAPAPSQGSAPTGNAYGDVGISPDTYAVTAAIEQAAQEFKQPTREREMVAGRYGPIMNYEFGA